MSRPKGTVTLLFSDIEGSTQRWERHRAAMPDAVRRHDALMQAAISAHSGHVFKTVGDAFCATFWNAVDAVASALDAQRSLNEQDWSAIDGLHVRIALHTGSTDERDGDYFGPAVNRVARLLAIAHGGQVVVSGITADLVQGDMPPRSSLRDLGAHRLKDLTQPEQVYQLVAPDLRVDFPPLRSLNALPNNLPLQLTSFVGRETEVAEIVALLEKSRLVTLVGTGGIGKTRTALQVAADLLDGSGDGVWFVDLAPLSDPSLIASAVSTALCVPPARDRPVLDVLLADLKDRRLLLVLDNCEHVVAEAARVADAILHTCPRVKLIVTSREGLNVSGERVYRMPSLRVPPRSDNLRAIDAAAYESIALFADRATAADGRFALSDENAPIVADICRRLDGIALAIELAAPRVKVLSVQQLSQRLDERFRILTGGSRSALPRQQTMRALIDWSYDLLSDREKTIFRRVSIFVGGWTLEATSEICCDEQIESWEVLDLLSALVDKSLVATELSGSHQRYRLLESMRQYARERLAQGSDAQSVQRRHATYFCRLADDALALGLTTPTKEWLESQAPELDNLRAALTWTLVERNDVQAGAAAAGALYRFFDRLELHDEAIRWCEIALGTKDGLPVRTQARLHYALSFLCNNTGRHQRGIVEGKRAAELYRTAGDQTALCRALSGLVLHLSQLSRNEEARALGLEALGLARQLGDARLTADTLAKYALTLDPTEIDTARALFQESVSIIRGLGWADALVFTLIWWAEAEAKARHFDIAIALSRKGLESASPALRTVIHSNMAAYALSLGDIDQALPAAREALADGVKLQLPMLTAYAIDYLALISLHSDMAQSARLAGFACAQLAARDAQFTATEQVPHDILMAQLHEAFEESELARLMNEGAGWSEDVAIAQARAI